jgi:hypothetical protein
MFAGPSAYMNHAMTLGKKLAIGAISLVPAIALGVAVWALVRYDQGTSGGVFVAAIIVSGIVDTGLAAFYVPHVYDNPRLKDTKILWIVLLGLPYITVAPIYWLIYVLPEKPRPPDVPAEQKGGAWYADPWGEAPFRWWDGQRWTDWVTGPPDH